jgi:hypothetical protein
VSSNSRRAASARATLQQTAMVEVGLFWGRCGRQQAVETSNSGPVYPAGGGGCWAAPGWGLCVVCILQDVSVCLVAAAGCAGDCSLSCKHQAMRRAKERWRQHKVLGVTGADLAELHKQQQ